MQATRDLDSEKTVTAKNDNVVVGNFGAPRVERLAA